MIIINVEGTGRNIKQKRKELNLTVKQLVEEHFPYMTVQSVYQWENGKNLPSPENMLELSRTFDMRMEDLYCYQCLA
jgi:DNA-binding XRE family transcriptional regulator